MGELKEIVMQYGDKMTEEEATQMFAEIDKDQNSLLDFDELTKYIRGH